MTKRTNNEWLEDLRAGGDRQAQAVDDLRAVILRGMPNIIAGRIAPANPETEALVEEVAQETLTCVLDYLDRFEGRSQFTTWSTNLPCGWRLQNCAVGVARMYPCQRWG